MDPFKIPEQLARLRSTYLDLEDLLCAVQECGRHGRESIAQLWLSEGIPFAFSRCPALYACVRSWVGSRIDVSPKQIGLYGGARTGRSLARKKLGVPFDHDSDFDLFVVSQSYFRRLSNDYDLWSSDYRAGRVKPRSEKEREYWVENLPYLKSAMAQGYIDVWKIPSFYRYNVVQRTADSMWRLVENSSLRPRRLHRVKHPFAVTRIGRAPLNACPLICGRCEEPNPSRPGQ